MYPWVAGHKEMSFFILFLIRVISSSHSYNNNTFVIIGRPTGSRFVSGVYKK